MKCPYCGKEAEGVKVCPRCFASVLPEDSPKQETKKRQTKHDKKVIGG